MTPLIEEEYTPRTFAVVRDSDESGVSGTGYVLQGVVWHNGKVTVCWKTAHSSIAVYDSWEDFEFIHITSHPTNKTRIAWFTPCVLDEVVTYPQD